MILILAALISVVAAHPTSRIVGGSEAAPHSHPYIASLQRATLGIFWSHSCGCSLISPSWCLTAAHCVDGASSSSLRVQLGEHSLSSSESGEQRIGVRRVVMHPGYNGNAAGYPNDIALLELNSAATISSTVQLIDISPEGASYEGQDVIISGWGRTVGGGTLPDRLQEVTMQKISNAECTQRWAPVSGASINDQHICIYDSSQQASACNGDSGGPMIIRSSGQADVLVGVTSWGISTCGGDYPSVYTRVSEFISWINSYVG
ncbi:fibrinolytic enzyme, isozyme C-like [Haliotis rufescens]|uniref:fibrinolytic enzyme, isozyme C-like n=1 Tax=Haliotis rufescens TaxID=6454 RepID=UPI001EB0A197|nr:fibrinolytic enzyme, isozyme C-like [Haliotis rufescens]